MLKRFMVFYIEAYYPGGGMNDFLSDFEELDEAKLYVTSGEALTTARKTSAWGTTEGVFVVYDQETRTEVFEVLRG